MLVHGWFLPGDALLWSGGLGHTNNIKHEFVMLPGMAKGPRIAIIGAGNLGSALAVALRQAGYQIEVIVTRLGKSKRNLRARDLATEVGARVVDSLQGADADLVWFCVPDAEIRKAALVLADGVDWKDRVASHASGALSSRELDVLRKRGASVASVHPMMTFVRGSRPRLTGVSFAIEGDARAVRVARDVVTALGGIPHSIRQQDKAAYHAWGTFASPLLTALLATTERVAHGAGVSRAAAKKRMLPILLQTLANYAEFGAANGFSGPIVRGDVETVKKHLRGLREVPAARRVYVALADAALQYLPAKNQQQLRRALRSDG